MKCNLCGQEYEFSLGHRCRVMQEESKQPQPDLVSKLRELKAKVEASRDGFLDGKPYILTYSDIIVELESLLGREGQAAPLSSRADELNQCLQIIVTQAGNILDDLHAMKGAGVGSEIPDAVRAIEAAVKRASKVTWRVLEQPSPSTPIVPGTAGLSAEQVREAHVATMRESLDFQDSYFYRKLADRLNALLRTERPAPAGEATGASK